MFLERDILFDIPTIESTNTQILGNGAKGLAIILSANDLSMECVTLCKNIMNAIKHDFDQDIYRIIVHPEQPIIINDLNLVYRRLVVFGLKPQDIGLNIEYVPNFVLSMDTQDILFTSLLSTLNKEQSLKTQLWNSLQLMLK